MQNVFGGYFLSPQDEWNIPSKTMNMISTDDHQELVLVFMPYYYWYDIGFKVLCTILKSLLR